jgi:tetratricopeptide (TPR) repeat protein
MGKKFNGLLGRALPDVANHIRPGGCSELSGNGKAQVYKHPQRKHMAKKSTWVAFPYADRSYEHNAAALKKAWPRLHRGDAEPLPKDAASLEAWAAFHAGDFATAQDLGLAAGGAGVNAANKAACIYANYLEDDEKRKLLIYQEAAARSAALQKQDPDSANAYYLQAYALGRYAQGISIVKALKQGIGDKVKSSLETAIKLAPRHADAHIALGTYHAEIIDKVGAILGGLTYGAKKEIGVRMFETALKLNPDSAIARVEMANGLIMMYGKARLKDAERLYQEAAAIKPADAMERLDVELAKAELAE